jgi:hypothetical protein
MPVDHRQAHGCSRAARTAASTAAWTASGDCVVDRPPPIRRRRGERVEAGADALVERLLLGVEAVVLAARALQADAHRAIEEQRQMRRDAAARPGIGAGHDLEIEAATISLVGDRRCGEAIGEHDRARRDRRRDELLHVLGAIGEIEEELG